jgi:hypothetical protein
MGYKDITAGAKVARAKHARFVRPKNTLGIEIEFEFKQEARPAAGTDPGYPGGVELRTWVGWFPHDNKEHCKKVMKTLHDVLGFNGNDTADADGVLTDPQAFDWSREVQIVIELEPYEGKTYPKIAWVNKLGGSQFAACEPATLKNDLGALGFKAMFLEARQSAGQKPGAAKQQAPATQPAQPANPSSPTDPDGLPW